MDFILSQLAGFGSAFSALVVDPLTYVYLVTSVFLGITFGALPGLTATLAVTILTGFFGNKIPLDYSMIALLGAYVGAIYGGSYPSILLNIPGDEPAMMTCLDGYPMAQAGRPGRALGLGIMASFVGGLISWAFLLLLARPISRVSTQLGSFDYFALVMVALVLIASVSGKSLSKGIFSGMLGILAKLPGESPATGTSRWTLGIEQLNDGLALLPVLIGLFAVSQILHEVGRGPVAIGTTRFDQSGVLLGLADWWRHRWNMLRSSVIGTWVGILPGIGANVGSVIAYSAARGVSKQPEEFGQGAEEGIVASEAANNATIGGALIPLVAMGIPGSVIDAILLGALVLHGLQPGAVLFNNNPTIVYTIIFTMLFANVVMFLMMIGSVRWIARLARTPRHVLLPIIMVFCVVGSYALNNRLFDVWIMLAFGLAGFLMERCKVPLAPFVIGFVLAPIAEKKLGAGLQASNGSWLPLVTEPFALVCSLVALALFIYPVWRSSRSTQWMRQS